MVSETMLSIDVVELSKGYLAAGVEDRTYTRVLDTLGLGVKSCAAAIDAAAGEDPDWYDWLTDEECSVVENLLGAAYVVCQAHIATITSRALWLRAQTLKSGGSFTGFDGGALAVRSLGTPLVAHGNVIDVELVWELANYFKHRMEWRGRDWSSFTKQAKKTTDVISLAGLERGSTGNLRTGSGALGNHAFEKMDAFAGVIDAWGKRLCTACGTRAPVL